MKAIDTHAHYLPQLLIDYLKDEPNRFPYVKMEEIPNGTVRFKIGDGEWTRPVHPGLIDIDLRKSTMKQSNIDFQLNAGWLDIFGYNLNSKQGKEWSRFLNNTLQEASEKAGKNQFATLSTVPLQDGDLAAKVLEESKHEGHVGVMIGSWVKRSNDSEDLDLDHPSLLSFWQAAEEYNMPVYLHPVFAGEDIRTKILGMVNTIARPNETNIALSRLLYSGITLKFPKLKLIVSHGGGSLPFILGRLQRNYDFLHQNGEEIYNPTDGFKKLYFDSVVFKPEIFSFLIDLVGPEKIMLGSDDPFPIKDPNPRNIVESTTTNLDEKVKEMILFKNAQEIFNLTLEER